MLRGQSRGPGAQLPMPAPQRALSRGFPLHPGSRPWCSSPIYFLLPSFRPRTKYLVEKWCGNEAIWSPSAEVTAMVKNCPCSHVGTHSCGHVGGYIALPTAQF